MTKLNIARPTAAPIHPVISRRLLIALVAFIFTAISFSLIAYQVRQGVTLPLDRAVLWWIHDNMSPKFGWLVIGVTNIGGPVGTILIAGGLTILLWIKRRKHAALVVAAGVGGAGIMNLVLKYIFERTRPDLWTHLVAESSFSFPSGHAMASSALAFSLTVVFWRTRWRWWAIVGGSLYMLVIGFTRLYLGVHYPTDILGGWLVSAGWIAIVAALVLHYVDRRQSRLDNAA